MSRAHPVFVLLVLHAASLAPARVGAQRTFRHEPRRHRPRALACGDQPPGTPGPGSPGDCATDADCVAGPVGRCRLVAGRNHCFYESCRRDSDCPAPPVGATGSLGVPASYASCVCHGYGNSCRTGNCRLDGDCGPRGYCSPAPAAGCHSGNLSFVGMFCHTPRDTCLDDEDCDAGLLCGYNADRGSWECLWGGICPPDSSIEDPHGPVGTGL